MIKNYIGRKEYFFKNPQIMRILSQMNICCKFMMVTYEHVTVQLIYYNYLMVVIIFYQVVNIVLKKHAHDQSNNN